MLCGFCVALNFIIFFDIMVVIMTRQKEPRVPPRQGCKGFSSFSSPFSGEEKNRSVAEPGAARPGAHLNFFICLLLLLGENQCNSWLTPNHALFSQFVH